MKDSINSSNGLDLAGLGKIAETIPKEVYIRTTESVVTAFEKLIAPMTETTHGFGRYIRQKFDNMVEVEKALGTYTLERACAKAKAQAKKRGVKTISPVHPKGFVKAFEEASKETDPTLHELWAGLLASQMIEGDYHPHFLEILRHFSPAEAGLLVRLRDLGSVGDHGGSYFMHQVDTSLGAAFEADGGSYLTTRIDEISHWIDHAGDRDLKPWTLSCTLLCKFGFADLLCVKEAREGAPPILFRTGVGTSFLEAVKLDGRRERGRT